MVHPEPDRQTQQWRAHKPKLLSYGDSRVQISANQLHCCSDFQQFLIFEIVLVGIKPRAIHLVAEMVGLEQRRVLL